jgi:hypothetical protein
MRLSLLLTLVLVILSLGTLSAQNDNIVWQYNYPLEDTVLSQLGSIRGLFYDDDLLGDGVSAIVVTNYADNGRVHLFKTIGDNAMELVWNSPEPDTLGGGSTPRFVTFGDLDGDGRKEIIYQVARIGIFIYEWDGVAGSYNFGSKPSQIITSPLISVGTSTTEFCEYLEVKDYDNDGKQELIAAFNSSPSANDRYYVISAIGNWSTDSPGFSGFKLEFEMLREDPNSTYDYGFGGSPYAMIGADFDGDEDTDMLIMNYNNKNVVPITTVSADSFAKPDTSNDKAHMYLSGSDDVALMGGMAFDVDDDGREEVYLPSWVDYTKLHIIHYESGQSTREIDSSNVITIDLAPHVTAGALGWGYGDFDKDDKPNIYISSITGIGESLVTVEFQGGDKTDPANWTVEPFYKGDMEAISTILLEIDTLGNVIDTIDVKKSAEFVSKMHAKYTDFDKDGFEDILMPFQGIADSIDIGVKRWVSASEFVVEEKKEVNPRRNSIRILENSLTSGVEAKEMTIITPDDYELKQNYPNPFNPETNIEFFLPVRKKISLTIYNALGQKVTSLISDQQYDSGSHKMSWDGTNQTGVRVASGVYIYTLKYGNYTKSKRMTLLK